MNYESEIFGLDDPFCDSDEKGVKVEFAVRASDDLYNMFTERSPIAKCSGFENDQDFNDYLAESDDDYLDIYLTASESGCVKAVIAWHNGEQYSVCLTAKEQLELFKVISNRCDLDELFEKAKEQANEINKERGVARTPFLEPTDADYYSLGAIYDELYDLGSGEAMLLPTFVDGIDAVVIKDNCYNNLANCIEEGFIDENDTEFEMGGDHWNLVTVVFSHNGHNGETIADTDDIHITELEDVMNGIKNGDKASWEHVFDDDGELREVIDKFNKEADKAKNDRTRGER